MCGRYTARRAGEILKAFKLAVSAGLLFPSPRYNAAPSQSLPLIRADGARMMRWGFQLGDRLQINARSETAATLSGFKMSYATRRCVVLADGFFEWDKANKQPYFFARKGDEPFGLAGLWDKDGFLILTTAANPIVEPIHSRMPCMVEAGQADRWITQADPDLLKPFDSDDMTVRAVSKRVNRAGVDDALLIEPVELRNEGLFG